MRVRIIACALLAALPLYFMLPGIMELSHAGHEHDHEGEGGTCAVCAEIMNTGSLLKRIAADFKDFSLVSAYLFLVCAGLFSLSLTKDSKTLVSLKVRFNE